MITAVGLINSIQFKFFVKYKFTKEKVTTKILVFYATQEKQSLSSLSSLKMQ